MSQNAKPRINTNLDHVQTQQIPNKPFPVFGAATTGEFGGKVVKQAEKVNDKQGGFPVFGNVAGGSFGGKPVQ